MARMAGADPLPPDVPDDGPDMGGSLRQQLRDEEPVERFKPTSGAFVGWSGLALAAGVLLWVVFNEHSVGGLQLGLVAVLAALAIWITQFRPRVTAYPGLLVLYGSLRDTYIPYVAIDELSMGQTLNVWVGRRRYVCIGIGKSLGYEMRQRVRGQGTESLTGGNRNYGFSGQPTTPGSEHSMSYPVFVLSRLDDLIAASRRNRPPVGERPEVRQELAVREIAALVVVGVALALSFLL
jgi:hypothetical protein